MKSFLSGLGSILFGILWFVGIILLFIGGARVGAYAEPWIAFVAVTLLFIGLPICLVLLIFRKTRGWAGLGIYLLSWPLGLWLWIASFVYAISVSLFWTVIGILMGGLGIIPIAAIMTLIRRDWANCGGLVGTLAVVLVLRFVGLWIAARAEEREQIEAFHKEQAELGAGETTNGAAASPQLNPRDQQALEWAKSNPTDPRSAQILQRLGL